MNEDLNQDLNQVSSRPQSSTNQQTSTSSNISTFPNLSFNVETGVFFTLVGGFLLLVAILISVAFFFQEKIF